MSHIISEYETYRLQNVQMEIQSASPYHMHGFRPFSKEKKNREHTDEKDLLQFQISVMWYVGLIPYPYQGLRRLRICCALLSLSRSQTEHLRILYI